MRRLIWLGILTTFLGLLARDATAQPANAAVDDDARLQAVVEIGWDGYWRPEAWTPARVRIQTLDGSVCPAELRWYVPRPGEGAMEIVQPITINARPGSFEAYLPIGPDPSAVHLHVRDAETGQTLAWWPASLRDPMLTLDEQVPGDSLLIGVTGRSSFDLEDRPAVVAFLPRDELPRVHVGYDPLDVLILSEPNLPQWEPAQEQAVLEWVRRGGQLFWLPSGDLPPTTSPLAAAVALQWQRQSDESAEMSRAVPATMGDGPMLVEHGEGAIVVLGERPASIEDWPDMSRPGTATLSTSLDKFNVKRLPTSRSGAVAIIGLLGLADLALLWLRGDWKRRVRRTMSLGLVIALPLAGFIWLGESDESSAAADEDGWWVAKPRALEDVVVTQTADGHEAAR